MSSPANVAAMTPEKVPQSRVSTITETARSIATSWCSALSTSRLGSLTRIRAAPRKTTMPVETMVCPPCRTRPRLSIYGMGRFPVTLYKEQWLKLLGMSDDIRAFIVANEGQLKTKG